MRTAVNCIVELGVLGGVLWGCTEFYNKHSDLSPGMYVAGLLVYAVVGFMEWRRLRSRASLLTRLRLCWIIGPTLFLSLLLIVGLITQLSTGATKNRDAAFDAEVASDVSAQGVTFDQWWANTVQRMRTQLLLYAMLSAMVGLHLWGEAGRSLAPRDEETGLAEAIKLSAGNGTGTS